MKKKRHPRNDPNAHLRALRKVVKLKAQGKNAKVIFSVESGWTTRVTNDNKSPSGAQSKGE